MKHFNNKKLITLIIVIAIALLISLSVAIPIAISSLQDYIIKAQKLLTLYPLIDGHNDWSDKIRESFNNQISNIDLNDFIQYISQNKIHKNITHTDLTRLKKSKLGAQFWAIYTPCATQGNNSLRMALEQIDLMKRIFKMYPDQFQFVTNAKELNEAFKSNKIASLFGLEGGHSIDSSLAILRIFYELGIRYMTLTHNCNTPWADNSFVDSNSTAPKHNGLTDFGKLVVKEMNRLGMIVDISHVSYKTMLDVFEITKSPVMFSHSNVYNLCNHTRNVRDDVLLKLKENRGVIMLSFYSTFLTCSNQSNLNDVKKHINYVKKLIGVDYIGIGGDYDGVVFVPEGLEDVSTYSNLFASLLEDGWNEEDLRKIAGGNILRVIEENEKYSASVLNNKPYENDATRLEI